MEQSDYLHGYDVSDMRLGDMLTVQIDPERSNVSLGPVLKLVLYGAIDSANRGPTNPFGQLFLNRCDGLTYALVGSLNNDGQVWYESEGFVFDPDLLKTAFDFGMVEASVVQEQAYLLLTTKNSFEVESVLIAYASSYQVDSTH